MTDLQVIRDANALAAAVTELVAERDEARRERAECSQAAEIAAQDWQALVDTLNEELRALHQQNVMLLPEDWETQVHALGGLCAPTAFVSLLQSWLVVPSWAPEPEYPAADQDPEPDSVAEPSPDPELAADPDQPLQPSAPPVNPMEDTLADLPIVPAHQDALSCPNTLRCPHPGGVHTFILDATTFRCGVSGCPCGTPAAAEDGGKPIGREVTTDA